jgi:hypothetical protein
MLSRFGAVVSKNTMVSYNFMIYKAVNVPISDTFSF